MFLNFAIAILMSTIKNPKRSEAVKKQLRELRDMLNTLDLEPPEVDAGPPAFRIQS